MPTVHDSKTKQPLPEDLLTGYEKNSLEDFNRVKKQIRPSLHEPAKSLRDSNRESKAARDANKDLLDRVSALESKLRSAEFEKTKLPDRVESLEATFTRLDISGLISDSEATLAETKKRICREVAEAFTKERVSFGRTLKKLNRFDALEVELRGILFDLTRERKNLRVILDEVQEVRTELKHKTKITSRSYETLKTSCFGLVQDHADSVPLVDLKAAFVARMQESVD